MGEVRGRGDILVSNIPHASKPSNSIAPASKPSSREEGDWREQRESGEWKGVLPQPLVVSGGRSDAKVRAKGSSGSRPATGGGTALSVEQSGNVAPGSSFGEAVKPVESRANVSGGTAMPFAPRTVSVKSGSNECVEHPKHAREEQTREHRSGGLESEAYPTSVVSKEGSSSGVFVPVQDEGIFHARGLLERNVGHECASEGEDDSDASVETDSSEDENFNSSLLKARRLKEIKRTDKWREMIANFDEWRNGRKSKRFRDRVRKGVPDCVRGKVWQMMMGSTIMMEREPTKYADLVASDIPVEGPIEEDIPRTMYDHELFCRKSRVNGRDMLRRILTAYGRYDREVQYCQGMNYICSLFLLYMPEENAFWMLVASMNRPRAPLRELFLPGMIKAQEFQFVIDSLTKKHCRKLSNQILANNLTPAMYATQWFLTAFTQRFPYDLVTRVWDMFLLEDWKVFYRVCLALFKSVEKEAITLDLEEMNLLLRNMPPKVDPHEVLETAASIPLKHRHIAKRIALFHGDISRITRGDK